MVGFFITQFQKGKIMQLANPEYFKQFVQNKDSKTITTSETVAKVFGKYHKHVIRDIREIL